MDTDDLLREIERRMHEAIDNLDSSADPGLVLALTPSAHPAFDAAVTVAHALVMEERAKRGHAERCGCCTQHIGMALFPCKRCSSSFELHPIHDPRCAPQDERERDHTMDHERCCDDPEPAPPSETPERCPTCNRTRKDGPGQKCLLLPHPFHFTPRKG